MPRGHPPPPAQRDRGVRRRRPGVRPRAAPPRAHRRDPVRGLPPRPPPGAGRDPGLRPGRRHHPGRGVFLGSYDHSPNIDTALHLAGEVMPRVRRDLDAHLWLAGSNPPPAVTALQGEHVTVTGYVPDVETLLRRARVFVAPLRYGAGMKGKIGHAMSQGLPVVTTTIGAEGMGLVDGTHALVRDDPEGFAAAVVALHTEQPLWERVSTSARELVRGCWTPEAMEQRLFDLLQRTVWADRPEELSASSGTSTIPRD
ncbi:MAG: glycosyltransferase family 4 protein [Chloroflexi bacterium]|nr:MAG: glycosyltransferase family 4 protein [Chloroflexota bacterium]